MARKKIALRPQQESKTTGANFHHVADIDDDDDQVGGASDFF